MSEAALRFSAAEVNLLVHATEDNQRLLQSIENILSVSPKHFSHAHSEGHYKNKIILLKAILPSSEAGELALRIISLLSRTDREQLKNGLPEYADEKGNLYLRLNKQMVCKGKVSLSETDAIKIRFKAVKRYRPSGSLEGYRGFLSSIE